MNTLPVELRRRAMTALAVQGATPATALVPTYILLNAAARIEELEREVVELAATLQTSQEFNERAHVLFAQLSTVLADLNFTPEPPAPFDPKPVVQ